MKTVVKSVAEVGFYKDSLGRVNIEQSVNKQRNAARTEMIPQVEQIVKALSEARSQTISDWGGGWSWTAEIIKGQIVGTSFDIQVLSHQRQDDGTVVAKLAKYYWGDNGKNDAVIAITYQPATLG